MASSERGLKIVGQMLCRNEIDIISETVDAVMPYLDALVILDGDSDDGTSGTLMNLSDQWAKRGKRIDVWIEPDPNEEFHDHRRNRLLEMCADLYPDWIVSIDADEIYHTYYDHKGNLISPVTAIEAAERAGANVVRNLVPQFWLTLGDIRNGALMEDESVSIQARRRWYSWGHMGTFIWKWNPVHFYPALIPKRTPEVPKLTWRQWQIAGPYMPICKHYCIRSVPQGVKRARERLARGGIKYFGKYAYNYLISAKLARLHHLGPDDKWITERNHEALCAYMGGESHDE